MCAAFFIQFYGSQGSVGTFVECTALRSDLQHDRLRSSDGQGHDTFAYPPFSQGYLCGVNDVLSDSQGYSGKSAHHRGVSSLNDFCVLKLIHPRHRDALGLSTIYPRPVEFWYYTIPYTVFSVKRSRQHKFIYVRITVYPFTICKRVNRY